MSTISLKDRIVRYLLTKHGWISGGDIQRLVMEHTKHLPRTAVRRLQEAVEEGKLEVRYTGKHNHAEYKIRDGVIIPKHPDFLQGVGRLKSYSQLQKEGVV